MKTSVNYAAGHTLAFMLLSPVSAIESDPPVIERYAEAALIAPKSLIAFCKETDPGNTEKYESSLGSFSANLRTALAMVEANGAVQTLDRLSEEQWVSVEELFEEMGQQAIGRANESHPAAFCTGYLNTLRDQSVYALAQQMEQDAARFALLDQDSSPQHVEAKTITDASESPIPYDGELVWLVAVGARDDGKDYSDAAMRVRFTVSPSGEVLSPKILSVRGIKKKMQTELLDALQKWRFKPVSVAGERQEVFVEKTFHLRRKGDKLSLTYTNPS